MAATIVRTNWLSLGRRWVPKIGFSVGDQALVSAANLVAQLVLARCMEPVAYGSFVVAFSLLLFLLGVETALFAEPLSVLGPARYRDDLLGYVRVTGRLQLILSVALAVLPAAAGVVLSLRAEHSSLGSAFIGLALATPFYLLFAYLRRALYVVESPRGALAGSAVYTAALGCGLWAIAARGVASPLAGFLVIAVATLAADVVFLLRLGLFTPAGRSAPLPAWRPTAVENWRYGRWILWAGVAHWLGAGIFIPLLGAMTGLSVAGAFRAILNLVSPLEQTLTALGLLLLPWLSRRRIEPHPPHAKTLLAGLWALTVPLALVYGVALVSLGPRLVNLIYRRDYYNAFSSLLPAIAFYALALALSHGLAVNLRSLERPAVVFWAKLAGAVASLTAGIALTWKLGATGAAIGLALSLAAEIAVMTKKFPWREPLA